jgi:hypothetical protein
MEIVEDRHGRGSTLITSQLPVDKWHDVIGEPTFADAILDRIVHNAYRLELDGPSMRKLKAAEAAKLTAMETSGNPQAEPAARFAKQAAAINPLAGKAAKVEQK